MANFVPISSTSTQTSTIPNIRLDPIQIFPEGILQIFLDKISSSDLATSTRVCKNWHNKITEISSSVELLDLNNFIKYLFQLFPEHVDFFNALIREEKFSNFSHLQCHIQSVKIKIFKFLQSQEPNALITFYDTCDCSDSYKRFLSEIISWHRAFYYQVPVAFINGFGTILFSKIVIFFLPNINDYNANFIPLNLHLLTNFLNENLLGELSIWAQDKLNTYYDQHITYPLENDYLIAFQIINTSAERKDPYLFFLLDYLCTHGLDGKGFKAENAAFANEIISSIADSDWKLMAKFRTKSIPLST